MIFWNLLFFNREGYYCDCYYADINNTFVVNSILCNQDCDQNCSKQSSEIFCEKCGSYDGFYGNKYMLEDPIIPLTTQIVTKRPKRFTRDTRKSRYLTHPKRNFLN
jgi:hypothetical protein